MRTTVVPAQVTTVEDRIMGNLGFSQLALLVLPVFVAAGIFIILPPVMHGSFYKYLVAVLIGLLMAILAIRIKGKIILFWLITILRYNFRPKYYLFNKNTPVLRDNLPPRLQTEEDTVKPSVKRDTVKLPRLALHDATRVLETIQQQNSNLRFEMTKKGGLRVRFTEVDK
jgi:hypothetical protein